METNYEVIYLGYGEVDFIKEHEDHIRCYEALIEEMSRCEMHGRNIFGGK